MNIVAELFAPSHAHARRARERMELVVDDVGTGDPHRGPIDLTSGKVVIALGEPAKPAGEPEDAVPSDAVRNDAPPADAVPEDAVPEDAEPADAVPADAEPADAIPPGHAVPAQATPTPGVTPRP
ncbi:DUF6191 domain-containing protein [Streptomyces sp. WMMC500]|uniref:DUF6191 domain-containing protein n=1 Tax=Streptomyces sp. WMMC500 TaxID=3015154 RepID=UPI00248D1557|nr:DUF6191 domain-containing protein [Streptomyces sp. WMMC500]WBB63147.1 DUF6191 domain-containing protein [Streptomyces sp. WMMC500]